MGVAICSGDLGGRKTTTHFQEKIQENQENPCLVCLFLLDKLRNWIMGMVLLWLLL